MVVLEQKTKKALHDLEERNRFVDPIKVLADFGVEEGSYVADLGSGAGFFTLPAAEIVGDGGGVIAVDIQRGLLEMIRRKAVENYVSGRIRTLLANIEGKCQFKTKPCDFAIISNVLYQSGDREKILNCAKKMLKKTGKLLLIDWKKDAKMGPDVKIRMTKDAAIEIARKEGFEFEENIDAGLYHWGIILKLK